MHKLLQTEDSTFSINYYATIGSVILQLLLHLTFQVHQVKKVKGAMRMYLSLDFLSVVFVNATSILYVLAHRKTAETWTNGRQKEELYTSSNFENIIGGHFAGGILSGIKQYFLSMRNGFIVLIVHDAYMLVCKPFDFQEYAKRENQMRRYGSMAVSCFMFHGVHIAQIITLSLQWAGNLIAGATTTIATERTKIAMICLSTSFHWALLAAGIWESCLMKKNLDEMAQNEFGQNSNCVTLYKMSIALVSMVAFSSLIDILMFLRYYGENPQLEMYTNTAKTFFDLIYATAVLMIFFACFPRLRPSITGLNRTSEASNGESGRAEDRASKRESERAKKLDVSRN